MYTENGQLCLYETYANEQVYSWVKKHLNNNEDPDSYCCDLDQKPIKASLWAAYFLEHMRLLKERNYDSEAYNVILAMLQEENPIVPLGNYFKQAPSPAGEPMEIVDPEIPDSSSKTAVDQCSDTEMTDAESDTSDYRMQDEQGPYEDIIPDMKTVLGHDLEALIVDNSFDTPATIRAAGQIMKEAGFLILTNPERSYWALGKPFDFVYVQSQNVIS